MNHGNSTLAIVAVILGAIGVLPLLVGAFFLGISGVLGGRTKVIAAAPELSCAAVAARHDRGAPFQVHGQTMAGRGGPLRAPLSGAPCVSWRHEIQYEYTQHTNHINYPTPQGSELAWRVVSGPYLVTDDTGEVLVDPMLYEGPVGGLYDLTVQEEYTFSADPDWCHRGALGHLLRTGELSEDVIRPPRSLDGWWQRYILKERVIPAGRPVYAHGAVGAALDGLPVVTGTGVVAARVSTTPLVEPARRAARRTSGCAWVLVVVGFAVLALAGGLLLLSAARH